MKPSRGSKRIGWCSITQYSKIFVWGVCAVLILAGCKSGDDLPAAGVSEQSRVSIGIPRALTELAEDGRELHGYVIVDGDQAQSSPMMILDGQAQADLQLEVGARTLQVVFELREGDQRWTLGKSPEQALNIVAGENPVVSIGGQDYALLDDDGDEISNLAELNVNTHPRDSDVTAPETRPFPVAGDYGKSIFVSLSCGASNCVETFYTIDGSDPLVNGNLYSGAISIAGEVTLRYYSVDQAGNIEAVKASGYCAALECVPVVEPENPEFVVTKSEDTADGVCDADCSLREAVIAANERPGMDRIYIPSGDYMLSLAGRGEDEAQVGDLDILDDVHIYGDGGAFIDADKIDRVFHVFNGIIVELKEITVRNGFVIEEHGGALWNDGGAVFIESVDFDSNEAVAGGYGGAIRNRPGGEFNSLEISSTMTIRHSRFFNNYSMSGAAIENGGDLSIYDSIFENNGSTDEVVRRSDGAVHIQFGDNVLISRSVFANNRDMAGVSNQSGAVTVENTSITGNLKGVDNWGSMNVQGSTIAYNSSNDSGAGIYNAGDISVINSTIAYNEAAGAGGGIFVNSVLDGGVSASLENSLIFSNAGSIGADCYDAVQGAGTPSVFSIQSFGANIFSTTQGCDVVLAEDDLELAFELKPEYNVMMPGSVSFPLSATGPAINAAHATVCPDTDQYGNARKADGFCDIGAREYQVQTVKLNINFEGVGLGSIASTPDGLSCNASGCQGWFAVNSDITLTALPDNGSALVKWGGGCSGASESTTVNLTDELSCSVEFSYSCSDLTNLALNNARTGFPHPLESNAGWGGASNPWEIIDGKRVYSEWAHGLAFTGGHASVEGGDPWLEPAGVRQTVIDFGKPTLFEEVVIWHYGEQHMPETSNIEYWDDEQWLPMVDVKKVYPAGYEDGGDSVYAIAESYAFSPVLASKVRYSFDNSGNNVLGSANVHGRIFEMEVNGCELPSAKALVQ